MKLMRRVVRLALKATAIPEQLREMSVAEKVIPATNTAEPEKSDQVVVDSDAIDQLEARRRLGHPDGCQDHICSELRRQLKGQLHLARTVAQLKEET